jgi:hypothetical protein
VAFPPYKSITKANYINTLTGLARTGLFKYLSPVQQAQKSPSEDVITWAFLTKGTLQIIQLLFSWRLFSLRWFS